jgi:hypothetical protein
MDRRGVTGAGGGGTPTRPIAPENTAGAASGDFMPGPMMRPRELDYSDQSAAVSPGLMSETVSALGVPITPASFSAVTDPFGTGVAVAKAFGEAFLLDLMRMDANVAGIALQGVELLPMRLHDNNADFDAVEYLAWTNSGTRVYVNIPRFIDIFNNAATGTGFAKTRATAIFVLRHEDHHVTQFQGNGNATPPDFATMIAFEQQAYSGDAAWLQTAAVQNLLVGTIGAPQQDVNDLVTIATQTAAAFQGLINDPALTTEAKRQDAMKAADMIPQQIKGKAKYKIADMYRTKAP